ncbi:hypothetical protein AMECASPLE_000903 [Ameca splendens]|uniref:Uncharacterized protein n=1 Tax=Ameca splendens TaxID=208324 RepID=A0ABV0XLY8_9TELE
MDASTHLISKWILLIKFKLHVPIFDHVIVRTSWILNKGVSICPCVCICVCVFVCSQEGRNRVSLLYPNHIRTWVSQALQTASSCLFAPSFFSVHLCFFVSNESKSILISV